MFNTIYPVFKISKKQNSSTQGSPQQKWTGVSWVFLVCQHGFKAMGRHLDEWKVGSWCKKLSIVILYNCGFCFAHALLIFSDECFILTSESRRCEVEKSQERILRNWFESWDVLFIAAWRDACTQKAILVHLLC